MDNEKTVEKIVFEVLKKYASTPHIGLDGFRRNEVVFAAKDIHIYYLKKFVALLPKKKQFE